MDFKTFIDQMELTGIIPVIKLKNTDDAVPLAKALRDGGINCAEVTFRAEGADKVIKEMTKAFPDMLVGAGTVLTTEQVDRAVDAGAKFCVAPGLNPKVVQHCLKKGVPFAPGVANGSQIEQAIELGLDFVKFFPAEQAGGLSYIKAISAPYSQMRFMPTGGISEANLNAYLAFPKVVCCGGSWIVPEDLINEKRFDEITKLCENAVNKMLNFDLVHIGVNCKDEKEAESGAEKFEKMFGFKKKVGLSSVFAGTIFEFMKQTGRGKNGHVAIAANSVKRAVYHLARKGFEVDLETARYDESGKLWFVYLKDEVNGFAVHLVERK